jgi:putative membrane protein
MGATATTPGSQANTRPAIAAILAISAAATLFLFWLIYQHPAADTTSTRLPFLPALNAVLNGLSATALLVGFTFIHARKIAAHRASMITAFIFSTLFLCSYILHHYLHGDVRYPDAPYRLLYLPLLVSHIILAVIALPMVLVTFFFSLSGRFPQHRKVARWTFPLWLYVSVTGVITFVMLRLAQGR